MKAAWIFTLGGAVIGGGLWLLFLALLAAVWHVGSGLALAVISQPEELRVLLMAGATGAVAGFAVWFALRSARLRR